MSLLAEGRSPSEAILDLQLEGVQARQVARWAATQAVMSQLERRAEEVERLVGDGRRVDEVLAQLAMPDLTPHLLRGWLGQRTPYRRVLSERREEIVAWRNTLTLPAIVQRIGSPVVSVAVLRRWMQEEGIPLPPQAPCQQRHLEALGRHHDRLVAALAGGATYKEIAEELRRVDPDSFALTTLALVPLIQRYVTIRQLPARKRGRPARMSDPLKPRNEQIKALYLAGHPYSAIGRRFNLTRQAVHLVVTQLGLPSVGEQVARHRLLMVKEVLPWTQQGLTSAQIQRRLAGTAMPLSLPDIEELYAVAKRDRYKRMLERDQTIRAEGGEIEPWHAILPELQAGLEELARAHQRVLEQRQVAACDRLARREGVRRGLMERLHACGANEDDLAALTPMSRRIVREILSGARALAPRAEQALLAAVEQLEKGAAAEGVR